MPRYARQPKPPFSLELHTENHLLSFGLGSKDRSIDQHTWSERLEVLRTVLTLAANDGASARTGEKLETAGIAVVGGPVVVLS